MKNKLFPILLAILFIILLPIVIANNMDKKGGSDKEAPTWQDQYDTKQDLKDAIKNGNADATLVKKALGKDGSMTVDELGDNLRKYQEQIPKEQYGKLRDQQIKSMDWNNPQVRGNVQKLGDKVQHIPPDQASPELVNEMTGEQREELDGEQWQNRYRYFTIPKLTITAPVITTANRIKGSA